MVKVGLDATPLTVSTGGVARYTAELSGALAVCFPEDDYWLLSDQEYAHPSPWLSNLKKGRGAQNVLERRWWLWGLQAEISRLHLDVFHGTDFSVPYLPVRPSVMTLHDLSPWLDPNWHADADRVRRRTPVLLRVGLPTMIVTPTQAVRRQTMERFRVSASRIVAVPEAAGERFRPVPPEIGRRRYLLCVGTLEPRKNLGLVIEAWREARNFDPDVELWVAGRKRRDFREPPPEPGLRLMGEVREEALPGLYSGAIACLYPSWYEGFGLPVLEAMQCGAAVLASKDPALEEVSGGAALHLDPADPKAWADAMKAALAEPDWLGDLREKAIRRAREFSWNNTAKRTHEVYDEAIRRFRKSDAESALSVP